MICCCYNISMYFYLFVKTGKIHVTVSPLKFSVKVRLSLRLLLGANSSSASALLHSFWHVVLLVWHPVCLGLWWTPNWCTHFLTRFTGWVPSSGRFTPTNICRAFPESEWQPANMQLCLQITLRFTVTGSNPKLESKLGTGIGAWLPLLVSFQILFNLSLN